MLNDFVDEYYDIYDLSSFDRINNRYNKQIDKHLTIIYTNDYQTDLVNAYIPNDYSNYIWGSFKQLKIVQNEWKILICQYVYRNRKHCLFLYGKNHFFKISLTDCQWENAQYREKAINRS